MPRTRDTRQSTWPVLALARRWCAATAALLCIVATGCSQPRGEVFPAVQQAIVWPSPPDPPRIRYVGSISNEADLKPGKSMFKGLGEAMFGKKPVRAMLAPYSSCTDTHGRLFVCDGNAQMVHVFNLETRAYEQWRPSGDGRKFSQPVGVAIDSRDRVLVSDSVAGTIFVFDKAGVCLGEIGSEHLKRPCGLAYDAQRDRLYVADAGLHQVLALAMDGEVIATIGERGSALGQFNFPTAVAVDSNGNLFVSDTLNFRVQVFDSNFKPLRQIGRQGDLPGYFAQPKGIALDREDHLYVIDSQFEAVQIFDAQGRLLLNFGEEGRGPGQFWLPAGIHIDEHNRIWIADCYNQRVQVFDYLPETSP